MEEFVVLFLLVFHFGVGFLVGMDSPQETIDRFKEPVCVKQKVGVELIKKCYVLQEKK